MIPWILISILILIIGLALVAILIRKKEKTPPDYYNFFIMGIIWTGAGIPLKMYPLSVMGLVFMVLGLAHRGEWKTNKRKWKDLNPREKKIRLIITGTLALLVVLGFVLMFLYSKNSL